MASYSDIQHRFANKQAGKNGRISAGNVRYEGRNYFSYSTVFGQWVDISKNVVVIFDGRTSPSSSKHKLYKGLFPDDVHVFPLDLGDGYYGWRNCNLVSSYKFTDEDFKESHRMQMIDHYVERIYNQFAAINGGKSKGLENVSFEAWGYVEELCSLYKDTTIGKWIKHSTKHEWKNKNNGEDKRKRAMVRLISKGERNVETITDALFGEGTYKIYWDYCARYRKAADKKEKMLALCERLGIADPYRDHYWSGAWKTRMTADEVRKLTAKERNDIHFASLIRKEEYEKEDEREKLYNKRKDNAYRWIVGFEPVIESSYSHSYKYCKKVRSMYTGEVCEVGGNHIFGFHWLDTDVSFDYDEFRNSEDKEQWIADFYAKCKEVALNRKAIYTLKRIKAHTKEKAHSWDDDVYINDDYLRENTSPSEYILCSHFIYLHDKYFADKEARRRADEIARLKREEEERKEREYMEQVRKEQIDACVARGAEGARDLWRLHLTELYTAKECCKTEDFFYKGNVLLRMNLNKDKVETSKSIRIPVEVCKKMWRIVSKWHENPSCFKPMDIDTKGSGKYTISSYQNDILTAGCHKIAYTEMERMYNEIQGL